MELTNKHRKIIDNLIEMKDVVIPILGDDIFYVSSKDQSQKSIHEYLLDCFIDEYGDKGMTDEDKAVIIKGYYYGLSKLERFFPTDFETDYRCYIRNARKNGWIKMKETVKDFIETFQFPLIITTTPFDLKDGRRVSPIFAFWTRPIDGSDAPVLIVDMMTKKRRYLKYDSLYEKVLYNSEWQRIRSKKMYDAIVKESKDKPKIEYKNNYLWINQLPIPTVLEGEYDHAWAFSDDMAAVEINGKIGFINGAGEIVIKPKFDSPYKDRKDFAGSIYHIYRNGDKYAPFFYNGYIGNQLHWIDKEGRILNLSESEKKNIADKYRENKMNL